MVNIRGILLLLLPLLGVNSFSWNDLEQLFVEPEPEPIVYQDATILNLPHIIPLLRSDQNRYYEKIAESIRELHPNMIAQSKIIDSLNIFRSRSLLDEGDANNQLIVKGDKEGNNNPIDDSSAEKNNNYPKSIRGIYTGTYNDSTRFLPDTGNCAIIIERISNVPPTPISDKKHNNATNNSRSLIYSRLATAKIHLIKNDSSAIFMHFNYGLYDPNHGIIVLAQTNFTYNSSEQMMYSKSGVNPLLQIEASSMDNLSNATSTKLPPSDDDAGDDEDDDDDADEDNTKPAPKSSKKKRNSQQKRPYSQRCPVAILIKFHSTNEKYPLSYDAPTISSIEEIPIHDSNSPTSIDDSSSSKDHDFKVSGLIWSVNTTCARLVHSTLELSFIEEQKFLGQASFYSAIALTVVMVQFFYLFKQWKSCFLLGGMIRMSVMALLSQFIYSGVLVMVHFYIAFNVEALFSSFIMIAFMLLVNCQLQMRFINDIWRLRNFDRRSLVFIRITALLSVVWLSAVLMFSNSSWYSLFYILLFSDWFFQIAHNTRTGERYGWKQDVVIAVSLTRIFFPLYVFGCPSNLLQTRVNYPFCIFLSCWVLLQIWLMNTQDFRGARFWIPEQCQPLRYKYHRTMTADPDEDDEESLCAICLETLETDTNVMITPCAHRFHSECLTPWMNQRLTCPTCRTALPPLV